MLADHPAASHSGPVDFPYLEAGRRPCPPVVLHICVLTRAMARETWPLAACRFTCSSACNVDCPAASNGGRLWFPGTLSRGQSTIALSLQPPPWLFCNVSGVPPPAMSIDQWVPVPGTVSGTSLRSPSLPLRVKGTYSGEIKSLSRDPGIATLDSGMRFIGN